MLSSLSDALVALGRIGKFLTSEDLPAPYPVEETSPVAVQVNGDFAWETVMNEKSGNSGKVGKSPGRRLGGADDGADTKQESQKASESFSKKSWWRRGKSDHDVLPTTVGAEKEAANNKDGETEREEETEKPFELKNLSFVVPRGAFIGVVGRIGSGKVSQFLFFPIR